MRALLIGMFAVVGFLALALVGFALAGASGKGPGRGEKAPDFSLPGSDGKTHSLAAYRGKTVVLAWFPKAFTGG